MLLRVAFIFYSTGHKPSPLGGTALAFSILEMKGEGDGISERRTYSIQHTISLCLGNEIPISCFSWGGEA